MRESVYVAVGYAIANTIIVEGKTGLIVIDTTESLEAAAEILSELRKITSKPIDAIVYTHNHADHVQGTEVSSKLDILTHNRFSSIDITNNVGLYCLVYSANGG